MHALTMLEGAPKIDMPIIAWIVLNYKCNNRCVWCYTAPQQRKPMHADMKLELAKSLLEELSRVGIRSCTLIGGEPTIYADLTPIIRHGKDLGLRMWMITNGRLLSSPFLVSKLVNAGLDGLTVSVEGPDAKIHDGITRVKGSYPQTISGIKNCIAASLTLKTLTTISKENIEHAERMIDLLESLGVYHCLFNICTPDDEGSHDSTPATNEVVAKLRSIYNYAKGRVQIDRITTSLPLCLFDRNEPLVKNGVIRGKCLVFNAKGLVVDTNGDLLFCTHAVGVSIGSIARDGRSITADKIIHLWNEGKPAKVRQILQKPLSARCLRCEWWGKKCTGGCLFLRPGFNLQKEVESAG